MNKRTIVKVQKPLESSDSNPPWLVYDEKRLHVTEIHPDRVLRHNMGSSFKGYFYAVWTKRDHSWLIEERAPDQEW